MGFVAENRIADITEVRHLGVIEEQRVFELARIPDHAAVPNDYVFAQISIVPNLAILPDDRGPLDHDAILHHRACADENMIADPGTSIALVAQLRPEILCDVV